MIVLRTRGCEYARKTGGCTVCGFLNHADDTIGDQAILGQLDGVLASPEARGVGEIDLLTLGSFLNDREVSPRLRHELLARVATLPDVERVSFESRAEYVTKEKLSACKRVLGTHKRVELGIGLESADDHVRNTLVRKDLSKSAFRRVVSNVADVGLSLLAYLLIKPPGLSERQAIDDAVASARYVFAAAAERGVAARIAFEPVFVCANTNLEELYSASDYRLVNLWSVVNVILQVHTEGEVFVGLSDEGLAPNRLPGSCDECYPRIVDAIEAFNGTQDVTRLRRLDCECHAAYDRALARGDQ